MSEFLIFYENECYSIARTEEEVSLQEFMEEVLKNKWYFHDDTAIQVSKIKFIQKQK